MHFRLILLNFGMYNKITGKNLAHTEFSSGIKCCEIIINTSYRENIKKNLYIHYIHVLEDISGIS